MRSAMCEGCGVYYVRVKGSVTPIPNSLYGAHTCALELQSWCLISCRLYIRDVTDVFSVGQECPKMEVPGPNSKQDKAFQKDFLTVRIHPHVIM